MSLSESQLADCRAAAVEAARLGAEVLEYWQSRFEVREKGYADLVTDADPAAQRAIQEFLHQTFPQHGFLGEEQAHGPDAQEGGLRLPPDAPPTWIVDPLDGTANYAHGCPFYCVSIGLWDAGELVVGVIHDPRAKEVFSAAKGQGATLNGKPIRVSPISQLRYALISTGFPPDPNKQRRNLDAWQMFSYRAQALRRTGSTALNLAYVAAGRYDAYWAYDNFVWDVAAGVVLVQEAGGVVSRVNGEPFDPFLSDLLASNGQIQAEMLAGLQEIGAT